MTLGLLAWTMTPWIIEDDQNYLLGVLALDPSEVEISAATDLQRPLIAATLIAGINARARATFRSARWAAIL